MITVALGIGFTSLCVSMLVCLYRLLRGPDMPDRIMAVDSFTGKKLWEFQTGSGIIGQPVTWQQDGRQYVSVASGIGGAYTIYLPLLGGAHKELVETLGKQQPGGSVWTFALLKE